MTITRRDLDEAVRDAVLSREQAERLWDRAHAPGAPTPAPEAPPAPATDPRREAAAVAGSVAAVAFAVWLLLVAWDAVGPAGGFGVAALATGAFALAARALERRALRLGAALLAGVAVAAAPLAVHGLHGWIGYASGAAPPGTIDAFVRGSAFPALVAGIVAGVVGLRAFSSPSVAAVLVGAVWFAAMLGAPVVFGPSPTWAQRALLSALTGVGAIAAGVFLDARTRRDYSFWLYLSGLVAFWGALVTVHADSVASQLVGAVLNLALVLAALPLRRPLFAVFGVVGLAGVLGHVAEAELEEAAVPFVVLAIAAASAGAAVAWRRLAPEWEALVAEKLPDPLRRLLPARRRS